MTLHPRFATSADVQLYFDWTNDPDTRRQSFHSEPIPFNSHVVWFTNKIASENAMMLVFDDETGTPVGQVRFERTANEVVIGLSVDAGFRGKGLASQLISQACQLCCQQWQPGAIIAYIKPDNQASIRSFERAGFIISPESGNFAFSALVYTYSC